MWEEGVHIYGIPGVQNNFPLKTIIIIWFKLYIFLEEVQIINGISLHFFKTIHF